MICKNCNRKLPDDSEFCQYCGIEIAVEEKETKENAKKRNETKHCNLRVISISIFSFLLVSVSITMLISHLFFMNKYNEGSL